VPDSKLDLAFAGSSEFAVPTLAALVLAGHRVTAVLTQPDRPAGRKRRLTPTPVKTHAFELGLTVMEPTTLRSDSAVESLREIAPDLMVVVDYGLIIPPDVLAIPRLGCINGHASLLPRWRGAAPIERAILAGDRNTGVSVMRMDEGLDTGDVLLIRRTQIGDGESAGELRERLAALCAEALTEAVQRLAEGGIAATPQDSAGVCYAAKLTVEEAALDWTRPAIELARRVHAYNPRPGAHTIYRGQRLKVLDAVAVEGSPEASPGEAFRAGRDGIDVAAGEGALRLLSVQLPGGRPLSAPQFLNGHGILGEILGSGSE
jgi:methionyl-tRNA formyltransferase